MDLTLRRSLIWHQRWPGIDDFSRDLDRPLRLDSFLEGLSRVRALRVKMGVGARWS